MAFAPPRRITLLAAVAVALPAVILFGLDRTGPGAADRGRALYAEHCASCHGANLEGAPDWQSPLPSGRMPAPPHDASGHTWHHSDAILFRIVKEGTAAVVGNGYQSDMPGFGPVLDDAGIRDILAYIKSTWPERERGYQQQVTAAQGG